MAPPQSTAGKFDQNKENQTGKLGTRFPNMEKTIV